MYIYNRGGNMNLKKFVIALLVICPLVVGCGSGDTEKKKPENNNQTSSQFKNVTKDNLIYRNTSFEKDENGYTVITEVENKSDMPRTVNYVYLDLKDKDGNVVETLTSYVGEEIKPHDSAATIAKTAIDLSKVKTIEYSAQ